jgi:hypothetical protein
MTALCTMLGVLLVCGTLREIFRDLFHPSGSGALSSFIGRSIFGAGRRLHWMLPIAGPLTIVAVIAVWSLLLTVGFGLIYGPHYPDGFQQPFPEPRSIDTRVWSVLYYSLATLTTLASGGLTPKDSALRICVAIESLIGIGLITASVTWIVLLYPALGRMRAIARGVSVLKRAREKTETDRLAAITEGPLFDFARRVVRLRIDFIHFPLIYYFHEDAEEASLPRALPVLLELAREGCAKDKREEIRLSAAMLETALNDLAEILTVKFVRHVDSKRPQDVFRAIAADHLQASEADSHE